MSLVDKTQSIGAQFGSRNTKRVLLGFLACVVAASLLAAGMVGIGAADSVDLHESNVSQQSDDGALEIEVSAADEFVEDDSGSVPSTATATVTWYDAAEYANASDGEASSVHSETIEVEPGQTIANSYDFGEIDALSYGDDYTVVVTGEDDNIDDVSRTDGLLGGGIGGSDGSPGFGVGVAIVAMAAAALVAAARRE